MGNPVTTALNAGPGGKGNIFSEKMVYFDSPQSVITLEPFTITLVTVTAPVGFLGDRAAILPAGMAAATDGANYWVGTAAMRPQPGKAIEIITTMRAATFADPQFVMGLGVVSTSATAKVVNGTGGDLTDYILLTKDKNTANPVLMARKASGVRETANVSLPGTVDAEWLRIHMILTRDPSTAGKGRVQLFMGSDSLGQLPLVADWTVPTQFADTVSMAPGFGWLSGQNNTGLSHGLFGWKLYN